MVQQDRPLLELTGVQQDRLLQEAHRGFSRTGHFRGSAELAPSGGSQGVQQNWILQEALRGSKGQTTSERRFSRSDHIRRLSGVQQVRSLQ
jgi:hypothetical protein